MKRAYFFLIITVLLSGCGSDSDNSSGEPSCDYSQENEYGNSGSFNSPRWLECG